MRFTSAIAFSALAFLTIPSSPGNNSATAQSATGFDNYMQDVGQKALQQGVSQKTLDRVLPSLSYNPRVIQLDQAQPGGRPNSAIPPFAPYKRRHVDAARINGGKAKYRQLISKLAEVERETGVPGPMIMAIYGHETNYGRITGNFDIPRALATLAYEGRRRALFEAEFLAVLKMIDEGVPQSAMKGSWAGAMGKPQFLPSVYLKLAKDGSGDGYADIWNSEYDAVASIANYFVNAGWRKGEPWGIAVRVPASLNRSAIENKTKAVRCPRVHERHSQWKNMAEWRALGVAPATGRRLSDETMATLLEPDGPGKTAYLLTGNYRVILDYNCSNFYALSVGLLADEIRS
ncbi:lytic murein transglycosylase [Parasphingorhabdus cellanae]|uniref:Lytic murein transglycosylase n=1 Tax=Parasphingorhabdus cellanae TaxID=2806553 RepID=A0ABX7T7X0_9SPHN|nr:lytic murein transglycosylase [Parasphingorhabdus cellanae]